MSSTTDSSDIGGPPEVDLIMVSMTFDAADADRLLSILSKYVVMSRGHPGCRNIDLVASATKPGRFLVIQKWESVADQQEHFDSAAMVEMAEACGGVLAQPPAIDLLEPISAQDLE
jgi:quinol monooxygenase YgiN